MKKIGVIVCLMLLVALTACTPIRIDGPYKGRILDEVTGQPIEGAVVLGVWYSVAAGPGGGSSKYYDAQETVTDKDGNFEIKGLGLKIMTTVEPMGVIIFKTGYEYIGFMPWESFMIDKLMREKVKWEWGRAIIPMKKLTMEERRKQHADKGSGSIPDNKMRLLIKELNKEYSELGISLYPERY
jgi:hypothetical protein